MILEKESIADQSYQETKVVEIRKLLVHLILQFYFEDNATASILLIDPINPSRNKGNTLFKQLQKLCNCIHHARVHIFTLAIIVIDAKGTQ